MTENTNIISPSLSDKAIVLNLAAFIKHHRLEQNKSQQQLATEAGINRSTLSEFEKGTPCSLITFIQLLRALKLIAALETFNVKEQISPIQLAELELEKRKRASKKKKKRNNIKPGW